MATAVLSLGLALLTGACGKGPSSAPVGGAPATKTPTGRSSALGFSHCMRSHGVPSFPDPTSGGDIPKVSVQQLGVSSSQFQAAEEACQALLPVGSDDMFPPGEVQQLLVGMLQFSQCMRSHGVAGWPDPTTDSEGQPLFQLSTHGFTRQEARSPTISRAIGQCQHLLPAALGGTPIG